MSTWRTLFPDNPMMVEITRFRRKFFGTGGSSVNGVIVALTAMIYIGIVALVWTYREEANPILLIYLQTFIFTLLGPAMLHASIAGERERRSWDFLLVAPVSHAQIVTGKFMGAGAAILACAAVLLFPILIGVAFFSRGSSPSFETGTGYVWNIGLAELTSVSWGLAASAMTLFFSARCRRGFIALGTVLGILVASLIVWPILVGSAGLMSRDAGGILNFFHPFWTITMIEGANYRSGDAMIWERIYGVPQIITYIGITAVFLFWTERTLRFADGEVKFLPKGKDA
jgi:ABC-type transport system involved in multi-copper enzyme maturation permease subunit